MTSYRISFPPVCLTCLYSRPVRCTVHTYNRVYDDTFVIGLSSPFQRKKERKKTANGGARKKRNGGKQMRRPPSFNFSRPPIIIDLCSPHSHNTHTQRPRFWHFHRPYGIGIVVLLFSVDATCITSSASRLGFCRLVRFLASQHPRPAGSYSFVSSYGPSWQCLFVFLCFACFCFRMQL